MRRDRRFTAAIVTCGLAVGAAATIATTQGSAAPAHSSAACENTQLTLYPGSRTSQLRYGEWTMDILVCPTKKPESWKKDSQIELNASASNAGLTAIEDSKLRVTATGQNKWNRFARYEATFRSKTCIPKVGWPCKAPGTWKVRFTVTADKRTRQVKLYRQYASAPDLTFALFYTP
ncbi:hypothetical protein P8605_02580 [Streptomyces sp. T-3]|nr:hypothetical protein [Streptomyces sp. T-3]